MASKRCAKQQLTQDNWEEEDLKEEAGTFKKADSEAIGKRIIKKAIRRVNDTSITLSDDNAGKSPFSNFSLTKSFAFTDTKKISTNGTIGDSSVSDQKDNDIKCVKTDSITNENSVKITPFVVNGQTTSSTSTSFSIVNSTLNTTKSSHSSEYYKKLAALNKCVSDWIKQHVDKNQYCILTPIFKDYETHLKDIEKLSPENSPEKPQSSGASFSDDTSEKKSTIAAVPYFAESSTFATFSFGNNKPFNFTSSSTDCKVGIEESADSNDNENSDDVPPVPEVVTFQEEGSVYSTKCKLFYKKDDAYVEKGVGTLFIKAVDGKTQLLIRADTTLGKILLNIFLTKNIPCSRLGKNNVSITCVVHPPLESKDEDPNKPVSLLIRVKSLEDAEKLLLNLNEFKV